MSDGIERAWKALMRFCIASLFVAWPLAAWKMVEILVWLCKHVTVELE